MCTVLVVGGSSGLGQAFVRSYVDDADCEKIYILDKKEPAERHEKITFIRQDLFHFSPEVLQQIGPVDKLILTAGYGKLAHFQDSDDVEIRKQFEVNTVSLIRILRYYYDRMLSSQRMETTVISSIAAHVVSPLFALYSASKAALSKCIEAMNVELSKQGSANRILEVSPGKLTGTAFYGQPTDLSCLQELTREIKQRMGNRETLFIPDYEKTYRGVMERNHQDMYAFGESSYDYKMTSHAALSPKRQYTVGYLSGTFDLFHVGHLNLLRRAKEQCDYLIVGVHESGSWKGKETFISFEDRKEIVGHICYVDKVITSFREDSDAWDALHYDKLFVGSDYKGTERFQKYEEYFADKGVEIVYFEYTKGVSSTMLREKLKESK